MYMLFSGYHYYPEGGSGDVVGIYETKELAIEHYNDQDCGFGNHDWGDILNLSTQEWTRLRDPPEGKKS